MRERVKDIWVLCLMETAAIANFVIFGLAHDTGWKDEAQYSAYAKNLLLGNGYSLDGVTIDPFREPGVAAYLLPFYKVLGIETPIALFTANFVQGVLLGILGFLIYRVVKTYGNEWIAIAAGCTVALLPILGDHANGIGTETLFTLFIGVIFFLCVRILRAPSETAWYWYALLGVACGYETLVRFQFALFPIFITGCFVVYLWYAGMLRVPTLRNTLLALVISASLPLSFASYIYSHTGVFAVTEGRQDEMLFTRTARTETGISGQTRYMRDWLWRSFSGGYNSQFLADHDYQKLHDIYEETATTSEAIARLRARSLQIIWENPLSYLYGNIIETIKLMYIEHDYSDSWSRYFRPAQYVLMYSFFLFGLYHLLRTKGNWDIRSIQILALLFIFYNAFVLSFFYTVSRFNTPYLPLFILVGFLGIVLIIRKRKFSSRK